MCQARGHACSGGGWVETKHKSVGWDRCHRCEDLGKKGLGDCRTIHLQSNDTPKSLANRLRSLCTIHRKHCLGYGLVIRSRP